MRAGARGERRGMQEGVETTVGSKPPPRLSSPPEYDGYKTPSVKGCENVRTAEGLCRAQSGVSVQIRRISFHLFHLGCIASANELKINGWAVEAVSHSRAAEGKHLKTRCLFCNKCEHFHHHHPPPLPSLQPAVQAGGHHRPPGDPGLRKRVRNAGTFVHKRVREGGVSPSLAGSPLPPPPSCLTRPGTGT